MTKIFMINAHEPEFGTYSPGKLNQSLFEIAASQFLSKGFKVKQTWTAQPWDIETEVNNHLWCTFNKSQSRDVKVAMSNTFGFGGHNACVMIKEFEE